MVDDDDAMHALMNLKRDGPELVMAFIATDAPAPDSDLIKRAQHADSDAFAVLFHAHRARIYSVCLRMTTNAAEAEDRTQDHPFLVTQEA